VPTLQPGLRSRWALLHTLLRVAEDRRADEVTGRGGMSTLSSSAIAGGLPALHDAAHNDSHNSNSNNSNNNNNSNSNSSNNNGSSSNTTVARSLAAGDGSTLGLDHPGARAVVGGCTSCKNPDDP
jgi:gamma-tubulin complex component 3